MISVQNTNAQKMIRYFSHLFYFINFIHLYSYFKLQDANQYVII